MAMQDCYKGLNRSFQGLSIGRALQPISYMMALAIAHNLQL